MPASRSVSYCLLISFQDVLVKAPDAIIEIPELEFEFGASKRRQVDSIYNFLAGAVFNLSNHVKDSAAMQSDTKNKIMETVDEVDWPPCVSNVIDIVQLTGLLAMERPWSIVVRDPSGISIFKPDDKVETCYTDTEALR